MPTSMPPVLGLTGGIASGKSTVARILREEGCVVADSDELAHEAFDDPGIRGQVLAWWGDRVSEGLPGDPPRDGAPPRIDRRAVAAIVFESPGERARLEALTHPWIARRRQALFAAAPAGTRALVIDAPLLHEAGLAGGCDKVIFVETPEDLRVSRAQVRRGWDASELARREAAQWPLDRKRSLADHVIRNDGDPASLRAQVRAVLDEVSPVRGDPGSPGPARSAPRPPDPARPPSPGQGT